ncbi:MAG TPA: hypothetical protein DCL61_03015 [Cyanobacteria bacterium UBA12227]|nr:hypothetical protein [Cyanobacteria bacterium UBA12227]HAX84802.1 hypothetical protein [Cyanobacteria bacterium UBA11370]
MKFNLSHRLGLAAAAVAIASICTPVQAATLGSVTTTPLTSTSGFKFAKNTLVNFTFVESHSKYMSSFGIYDNNKSLLQTLFAENAPGYDLPAVGNGNDWLGTCGQANSVISGACTTSYTFESGKTYFFGVIDQQVNRTRVQTFPTIFSDVMRFIDGATTHTYNWNFGGSKKKTINIAADTTLIVVNDSWRGDRDYNDMLMTANAIQIQETPEPGTVGALIGAGVLGLMARRRRQGTAN